ncbi:MAG: TolC family protein [Rhodocyclaceae bacterium]
MFFCFQPGFGRAQQPTPEAGDHLFSRSGRASLLAVLVWLPALSPLTASAGPPLTLARVQQLALENQPALAALQAEVRAGREGAVAEAQLPDPRLKLGLQNVPADSFALNRDPMTQAMVAIEQAIPGGDKRALRRRRGEAEAERAVAELAAQRQAIRRDAALAYVALVGARQQLGQIATLHAETARQVEATRIGTVAGQGSQADVLAARQMLTMTRDRESELQIQADKARAELGRWIGPAAAGDPAESLPQRAAPRPLAQLLDRLASHPGHGTSGAEVTLAEAELALAREASAPDKSIEIGYGRRAREFGDMVSIQFAMDLPLFPKNRQDRGIATRQARLERAQAMGEDHLRALQAEVSALYAEWQGGEARLARFDRELVPDAHRRVDAALANYRSGRGGLVAVLEARRAELEARMTRIQLATQVARARLQLAYFEDTGEDHESQH